MAPRKKKSQTNAIKLLSNPTEQAATNKQEGAPTQDLSYIKTLPNELLSEIFKLANRAREEDNTPASGFRAKESCVGVLCRVDKHWREVAFSTAELWTRIVIRGYRTISRATSWLVHSRRSMLRFELIPTDHDTVCSTVALLHAHAGRIEVLSLDLSDLPIAARTSLPLLPDLPVCVSVQWTDYYWKHWPHVHTMLRCVPKVKMLHFLQHGLITMREPPSHTTSGTSSLPEHPIKLRRLEELVVPCHPSFHPDISQPVEAGSLARVSFSHPFFAQSDWNHLIFDPSWGPIPDASLEEGLALSTAMWAIGQETPVESLTIRNASSSALNLVILLLGQTTWFSPSTSRTVAGHRFAFPRLRVLRIQTCSEVQKFPPLTPLWCRYTGQYTGIQFPIPSPLERVELVGRAQLPEDYEAMKASLASRGTMLVHLSRQVGVDDE